jgi:hypothetical protein
MAAALLAGCSSANGEATVLQVVPAFGGQGGRDTTIDTVDIGVPGTPNLTGHSVRWEHVSLVSEPAAVHLDSVFAYPPGPGIGLVSGNLIKGCPHYKAYPLTAAVVPPHAQMRWNVVIAVTFTKPGRYDLRRIRIVYRTDGHRGWQYQRINTTMVIRSARKGAKPRFSGCL